MIHKLSDVQSEKIGKDTFVWQFSIILKNAVIGSRCNINCNVFIENDVVIGDDVTIKPGVQIWDGITIRNKVMIGPNVTFTNDKIPISKNKNYKNEKTIINEAASIGANSTILCGIELGANTLVGAGSVLTKSTPPNTVWFGNPAIQKGFITKSGTLLDMNLKDKVGIQYKLIGGEIIKE